MQKGSGNVFAIKVITQLGGVEQQEELKKEIDILKKCTNKNIVSYYGCLTTDNALWVRHFSIAAYLVDMILDPDYDGLLRFWLNQGLDRDVQQAPQRGAHSGMQVLGSILLS